MEERLDCIIEDAIKMINKVYYNDIINFEEIKKITSLGEMKKNWMAYYSIRSGKIVISEKTFYDNKYSDYNIIRNLIHEIGHKIHFENYNNRRYSFSTTMKSKYAYTNHTENFAEAFLDYVIRGKVVTDRDSKISGILRETDSRHVDKIALENKEDTLITERSIIVLDRNFNIVEILENQKELGKKYNAIGIGGANLVPALKNLSPLYFKQPSKLHRLAKYVGWYFITYKDLEKFNFKYGRNIEIYK